MVINDNSFDYPFASKENAIDAFHQWLDICKELQKKRVRRVQEIYGNQIDSSIEIAPNYKIIQLVQEFRDREDRSMLLGVLLNSRTYLDKTEIEVLIDGKLSKAGAVAYENGMLVSLNSSSVFENERVQGVSDEKLIEIDNLSKREHIEVHSEKLGIRYYEPNIKHGKKPYIRSGGVISSEMDLSEDIAQEVLDGAIEIDGHLYGYHNEYFYEFRRTEKNIYHGYKNTELSKELKRKIIKEIQSVKSK